MNRLFVLIGGLVIWAAHFIGLYLISSAADVWFSADAPASRLIALGFSVACLSAASSLAVCLWRRRRGFLGYEAWEGRVGLAGAMVAAIGIVWQTAPLAF